MRLVTHSVVVCTSTHPGNEGDGDGDGDGDPGKGNQRTKKPTPKTTPVPRVMTMSSFTSLALAPAPVVSFNIAVPSRTHDAIAASGRFNIHVLADDAAGARVADWFAGWHRASIKEDSHANINGNRGAPGVGNGEGGGGVDDGSWAVLEGLKNEVDVLLPERGEEGGVVEPPVLKGDGVLYVLKCRLLDQPMGGLVRVRDHVIVLGEVIELVEGYGAMRKTEERFGLLYADRRYRQLGRCIMPGEEVTVDGDERRTDG
ncbi:hypothetical protein VTK26DRAFT_1386 [Humicola hyalothermophila]